MHAQWIEGLTFPFIGFDACTCVLNAEHVRRTVAYVKTQHGAPSIEVVQQSTLFDVLEAD